MKNTIMLFCALLLALLWLLSNVKIDEVKKTGQVLVPNGRLTNDWAEGFISFEHENNRYFLSTKRVVLSDHQGEQASFCIDPDLIRLNNPCIYMSGKAIPVIYSDVLPTFKPINPGLFYMGWAQLFMAIFSSIISIALWQIQNNRLKTGSIGIWDYRRRTFEDIGVFYLATAMILWGMISIIRIYTQNQVQLDVSTKVLSTVNNLFFLLSFPHFIYGLKLINENKGTYLIIVLISFFTALSSILWLANHNSSPLPFNIDPNIFSNWIDVSFSVITFFILGYLLVNSFKERQLYPMAWLSGVWMASAVLGQVGSISKGLVAQMGDFWNVNYINSFMLLSILITTLMFSWYTEQREFQVVEDNEVVKIHQELVSTDDSQQLIQLSSSLLARNKFELVIPIIRKKIMDKFGVKSDYLNTLANIEGQLNYLKQNRMINSVMREQLEVDFNRLRQQLLEFIEKIFGNDL